VTPVVKIQPSSTLEESKDGHLLFQRGQIIAYGLDTKIAQDRYCQKMLSNFVQRTRPAGTLRKFAMDSTFLVRQELGDQAFFSSVVALGATKMRLVLQMIAYEV